MMTIKFSLPEEGDCTLMLELFEEEASERLTAYHGSRANALHFLMKESGHVQVAKRDDGLLMGIGGISSKHRFTYGGNLVWFIPTVHVAENKMGMLRALRSIKKILHKRYPNARVHLDDVGKKFYNAARIMGFTDEIKPGLLKRGIN